MRKNTKPEATKSKIRGFPANVLTPVSNFLTSRLSTLEKRKKEIAKEDPFADPNRTDDNAAPDIEADEQFGHARTSALKTEINKSIVGIRKALSRIKVGKYGICDECGQMIDTARLMAIPTATLCAKDAKKKEK